MPQSGTYNLVMYIKGKSIEFIELKFDLLDRRFSIVYTYKYDNVIQNRIYTLSILLSIELLSLYTFTCVGYSGFGINGIIFVFIVQCTV